MEEEPEVPFFFCFGTRDAMFMQAFQPLEIDRGELDLQGCSKGKMH